MDLVSGHKQIEKNVGLHTHSSTHFVPAFPLRRVTGAAARGGPEIPHDQQHAISDSSAVSTPKRYQARSEI